MNRNPINTVAMDSIVSTHVNVGVSTMGIVFHMMAAAATPWITWNDTGRDNGRHQIGERVPIFSQCIPGGHPFQPDSMPSYRVYAASGSPAPRTYSLPIDVTNPNVLGTFLGTFTTDSTDSPGRYFVLVSYVYNAIPRSELLTFEIVGGGHPLGAIVSSYSVTRPDSIAVIAHTESGRITTGRNPYLDPGA